MVKVSLIMITAREDFPYLGREDLFVFQPTLEALKLQTMTDFEWVVMDVLYDRRSGYFENMDLPFKVKHVPVLPNLWIEHGFPGISTQYNKGIIYADGELLFFFGDSHMMFPNFIEQMWRHYQDGYFPLAWYFYDNTFSTTPLEQFIPEDKKKFKIAYPDTVSQAPVKYDMLGYTGQNISIEHRYVETFGKHTRDSFPAPWQWWFGCSSASLEAMLKINGFDQNFDGDRMLLDCDVGSRLELAGYAARFALFRDIFLIRCATDIGKWNPALKKDRVTIKCNYGIMWHSRFFNRYQANLQKLADSDVQWVKDTFCAKQCPIRELCRKEHPWQYPFEHKAGYPGHNSSKRWFNFWKRHQQTINLREERELRLSGDKKYELKNI